VCVAPSRPPSSTGREPSGDVARERSTRSATLSSIRFRPEPRIRTRARRTEHLQQRHRVRTPAASSASSGCDRMSRRHDLRIDEPDQATRDLRSSCPPLRADPSQRCRAGQSRSAHRHRAGIDAAHAVSCHEADQAAAVPCRRRTPVAMAATWLATWRSIARVHHVVVRLGEIGARAKEAEELAIVDGCRRARSTP
jgi:hypothetical protein